MLRSSSRSQVFGRLARARLEAGLLAQEQTVLFVGLQLQHWLAAQIQSPKTVHQERPRSSRFPRWIYQAPSQRTWEIISPTSRLSMPDMLSGMCHCYRYVSVPKLQISMTGDTSTTPFSCLRGRRLGAFWECYRDPNAPGRFVM